MLQIGPYKLDSLVVLAPMAGVSDLPFRQLCRKLGAGLVVSEMLTSDTRLWNSRKSQQRLRHDGELEPRSIQIAGSDPQMLAQAARTCVERGAQIVDINMGCPAKKVCKKAAGSALMKDEKLVAEILRSVVNAVDVPVTLKTRTGWSSDQRNAVSIARIAEDSGIAALTIHGRTRACAFRGAAEYDTIADVNAAVSIPVIANGDIDSPQKALQVMQHTGAAAVMVGRGAQGKPWLCREIDQYLRNGTIIAPPQPDEIRQVLLQHLTALHDFYGEFMGVKISRKHVSWYLQKQSSPNQRPVDSQSASQTVSPLPDGKLFRRFFNQLQQPEQQIEAINGFFNGSSAYLGADKNTLGNNISNNISNNTGRAIALPANNHNEVIAA